MVPLLSVPLVVPLLSTIVPLLSMMVPLLLMTVPLVELVEFSPMIVPLSVELLPPMITTGGTHVVPVEKVKLY